MESSDNFYLFLDSCGSLTTEQIKYGEEQLRKQMDQHTLEKFKKLFPEINTAIESLNGVVDLDLVRKFLDVKDEIYSSKITNFANSDIECLKLKRAISILDKEVNPIMNAGTNHPVMATVNYTTSINYLDAWYRVQHDVRVITEIFRIVGSSMSISVIEHTHTLPATHKITGTKINYREILGKLISDKLESPIDCFSSSPLIYAISSVAELESLHSYYTSFYASNPIKNIDIGEYIESLSNYLHCILYRRREMTLTPEARNYFKDLYFHITSSMSRCDIDIDKIFPFRTTKQIANESGVYKIDLKKLAIEDPKRKEDIERYLAYVERSSDRIYDFTFWMFIAHIHNLNGQTTIGYPHIHITGVFNYSRDKELTKLKLNLRNEIIQKTGLNDTEIVSSKTNPPNYVKAFGYLFKNSKNYYTSCMLPFETEHKNAEPFVKVYFYNKFLRDKLSPIFIDIATPSSTATCRSSNIFMSIYDYTIDLAIARSNLLIGTSLPQEQQNKFFSDIERKSKEDELLNPSANIKLANPKLNQTSEFTNFIQTRMIKDNLVICEGYIFQKYNVSKRTYKELKDVTGSSCSVEDYVNSFIGCEECNVSSGMRDEINI